MRYIVVVIFFFLFYTGFAQSSKFVEELENTPADSIQKIESLSSLIKTSLLVEYEYPEIFDQYNRVALLFYAKNQAQNAEQFFELAYQVALQNKDYERTAKAMTNIGVINELFGDYKTALEKYQTALSHFIEIGDEKSQSLVLNNIAIVHQELGNIDQAFDNLTSSHDIKTRIGDSVLLASSFNNLGVFYEECRFSPDSAIIFYNQALSIYKNIGDTLSIGISFSNLAQTYYQIGDYQLSEEYFVKAIDIFQKRNDFLWLAKTYKNYGLLKKSDKKLVKSVELLEKSLEFVNKVEYPAIRLEIIDQLWRVYAGAGLYEKSAETFIEYDYLQDSLLNIDKQVEINRLEIKFQTAQKELEIATLLQEKEVAEKRMVRIRFLIILSSLVFISVLIFVAMRSRQLKLVLKNRNMEIKQTLLQKQMDPHFLFNVLTSIQSFVESEDSERASKYLSKFSRLTRNVLNSSVHDRIKLSDEIDLLNNYLSLEQMKSNIAFDFKIEVVQNADIDDIEIPPMMIQPFVENAVKHGVKGIKNAEIIVKFQVSDDYVECSVLDNGCGIDKNYNADDGHKSLALSIIAERALILKKKWNRELKINFKNVDVGTKVDIVLPII
ncbi:MAG: tetratricopeptide repeat protein [Bacteroidales bacterium]|nr:tetratricopeptide repeat protein [Bacteroidales bacterium]